MHVIQKFFGAVPVDMRLDMLEINALSMILRSLSAEAFPSFSSSIENSIILEVSCWIFIASISLSVEIDALTS